MKVTLAIDGTNRIHMLWHVIKDAERVAAQFVRDIGTLVEGTQPASVLVAFDAKGGSFRRDLDPAYKIDRAAKPQGLIDALARAEAEARRHFPSVTAEGFEADDILATAAAVCVERGLRCVIASPDKDLRQCLVDGRVTILKAWKGSGPRFSPEWITAKSLENKYGIGPDQWVDYQCLVGDPQDGIVGAAGIGDKTARKILFEAGSIAKLLENRWLSSTITEKQWIALSKFKSRLPLVRQLVTLRTDVPSVGILIPASKVGAA